SGGGVTGFPSGARGPVPGGDGLPHVRGRQERVAEVAALGKVTDQADTITRPMVCQEAQEDGTRDGAVCLPQESVGGADGFGHVSALLVQVDDTVLLPHCAYRLSLSAYLHCIPYLRQRAWGHSWAFPLGVPTRAPPLRRRSTAPPATTCVGGAGGAVGSVVEVVLL